MADDGAGFQIDISATGGSAVDAAAKSVDTLAAQLEAAGAASRAAAGDVSAAEAAYKQAETSADRAAKAVEKIGLSADAQRGKLKQAMDVGDDDAAERAAAKLANLVQRQAEATTKAEAAKTAMNEQAAALDRLKDAASRAEKAEEQLATQMNAAKGTEDAAGKAAKEADEGMNFEGLERGLGKLGGPLGSAGQSVARLFSGVGKLTKAVGNSGPYVAMAVIAAAMAAAFFAAAAAAVAATIKIAAWAVGLADAARSASLLSQGIARSVEGGKLLDDKINGLTKTLPLTREELSQTAKQLADSGLRGKELSDALETSAINAAKLKFGPEFAKQMLSLDQQSKVFQANIASVFGGLKIDGLLEGLQKLVALFDTNTSSGKALKVVFESLFQPLIDWLTSQGPKIEAFFLQLEIWSLKALIAIKPYGSKITEVVKIFAIGAGILVGVFGAALALVVGLALALGAGIASLMYSFYQLGVLIVDAATSVWDFGKSIVDGAGQGVQWLKDKFNAAIDWLKGISLSDIGKALIDGLVQGITDGGAAILSAITGAVGGAITGAKKMLGIASPSKVFAEIGMQTGAGMEQGVDRSASGVQGALEEMTSPPTTAAPAAGGAAASAPAAGGKGGAGMNLQGAIFNFYGVANAEEAEGRFSEALTRLLEGDATQLGAAKPA